MVAAFCCDSSARRGRSMAMLAACLLASLSAGTAFLALSAQRDGVPSSVTRSSLADVSRPAYLSAAASQQQEDVRGTAHLFHAVAASAAVILFASRRASSRSTTSSQAIRVSGVQAASCQSLFAGAVPELSPNSGRDSTSIITCYGINTPAKGKGWAPSQKQGWIKDIRPLYLKKRNYKKRATKKLRARAYNMCIKANFKFKCKQARQKCKQISSGEPIASLEEAQQKLFPLFDECCLRLDEAAIQGVICADECKFRKDVMVKNLVEALVEIDIIDKPDPFMASYEVVGYTPPVHDLIREPRPWLLPGWKSPWTLFREFQEWEEWRQEKAKQEAEAVGA